jgi:hypothetical protein
VPNVNRWALRLDLGAPNPGAGLAIGRAQWPRDEAEMKAAPAGGGGAGQWHPTVMNLMVLIALEVVAFGALRWAFRSAHGG